MTVNRLVPALLLWGSLGAVCAGQDGQKAAAEKRPDADGQRGLEAKAGAQRAMADEKADVALVRLKYADPETVARLLASLGVGAQQDRTLRLLVISGAEGRVARAQKLIQEIDVPGAAGVVPGGQAPARELEFMVYIVAGLEKGDAPPVPKSIEDTVSQLRNLFPYASYRLLDTAILRVSEDAVGEVRGELPLPDGVTAAGGAGMPGAQGGYSITINTLRKPQPQSAGGISVHEFRCMIGIPRASGGRDDVNVQTQLSMKEGQQVVVGKAGVGAAGTLFVVVSARVVK